MTQKGVARVSKGDERATISKVRTHQKSTLGASLRLIKYSSFIAASCRAMAVSSNSSFPVLERRISHGTNVQIS